MNRRPMPQSSTAMRHGKACVIGSGPNGLAAAIVLAQAGMQVQVFEAEPTLGGACRTLPLTLPGFHHDFGSAVHPLAAGSPFFNSLPLADYGLQWIHPPPPPAPPLDRGPARSPTPSTTALPSPWSATSPPQKPFSAASAARTIPTVVPGAP